MRLPFILASFVISTYATDCDTTEIIKLGDACSDHMDCNFGNCTIMHSKCSDQMTCQCTVGYYGLNGTSNCEKYELGAACTTSDQCLTTALNSNCTDDVCQCLSGYYLTTSRSGVRFCDKVVEHTSCSQASDGDAFCGMGDASMYCQGNCKCPKSQTFSGILEMCLVESTLPACTVCRTSGGKCFLHTNDGQPFCECPNDNPPRSWTVNPFMRWSTIGDPMSTGCDVSIAPVGHLCDPDESILCLDENADCAHYKRFHRRYVCVCHPLFVAAPNRTNPRIQSCYKKLDKFDDPNCAACLDNGGQCYDVDDDGVHDGCRCPHTRSSSLDDHYHYCDTHHVNVSCDPAVMSICYSPHDTWQFPAIASALDTGEARLYVHGHLKNKNCWLEKKGGEWCIDLVQNSTLLACDTMVLSSIFEYKLSNTIVLQRYQGETTLDDLYMYVYCTYDTLSEVSASTVFIPPGAGGGGPTQAEDGEEASPEVSLEVTDEEGEPVEESLLGEPIQLVAKLDDGVGVYASIKVDVFLALDNPDIDSPITNTEVLVMDGCPSGKMAPDLEIDSSNPVAQKLKFAMFMMGLTGDNQYVYFGAAIKACFQGREAECAPSNCTRRRKRNLPGPSPDLSTAALRKFRNPSYEIKTSTLRVKRRARAPNVGGDFVKDLKNGRTPLLHGGDHVTDDEDSDVIMLVVGAAMFFVLFVATIAVLFLVKRRVKIQNSG